MPQRATAPLGGPFTGVNEIENEQEKTDFDVLLNAELLNGYLEARSGWSVMGAKFTDPFVPGVGQTVYTQAHLVENSTYAPVLASTARSFCVGAYCTRLADATLRFVVVRQEYGAAAPSGSTIVVRIYDDVGDVVGASTDLTATLGEPANASRPYVFCEIIDRVYFTNGNGIYYWDKFSRSTVGQVTFRQHPVYGADAYWITSQLRAKLMATHALRMFYAGIPEDLHVEFSGQIPSNDDTAPASSDGRGDTPLPLTTGRSSALFYPAHLMWSEPGYPSCVRHSSFWTNPDGDAITAIAAYKESVIIWTQNAMWIWQGDGLQNWDVRKLSDSNGCVSQRSVVTTNNGLLVWLSKDGICAFDGSDVKVVSERIMRTWYSHGPTVFPRKDPAVRAAVKDLKLPWSVDIDRLGWSTAVNRSVAGEYWVTLTTKGSVIPNNIILVWDYTKDRIWFHASRETDSEENKVGISSWDALLKDPAINDSLYAVTRNQATYAPENNDKRARFASSLCEYGGSWDETVNAAGAIVQTRIALLAVGARKGLADSDQSAARQAWLWIYGTHNPLLTSEASSEYAKVLCFTEWSGYDTWRASVTDAEKQEQSWDAELWPEVSGGSALAAPDTWAGRYFWQPSAGASTDFNQWDSASSPLDPTTKPTLVWLAPEMAESKVHLSSFPAHWFRLCLFESPKTRGHRLRMVGWSVDVDAGWRTNE